MGTGKTSVGKELASGLKRKFIEMDELIEKKEGTPINNIFAEKGEKYFRKVESGIAGELSAKEGLVISAGGGVVLNPDNIFALEQNGILICLDASPEEIYKRVSKEKHRPLLNVDDPPAKIKELLSFRKPYYDRIRIHVDTNGKSIKKIVKEIKEYIK